MVTCEERPEDSEGRSHAYIWGRLPQTKEATMKPLTRVACGETVCLLERGQGNNGRR